MKAIELKLWCCLFLIVICPTYIHAQENTDIEEAIVARSALDEMFSKVDKSKISTGLLLDYSMDLIDLFEYGGQITDSNTVTLASFEEILRSIRSASVQSNKPFRQVSMIMDDFSTLSRSSMMLDVGIALFKYNYIKSNALEDNLISYDGSKVYDRYDNNGVWINPYDEVFVFAFTPSTNAVLSERVYYKFSTGYTFTNQNISRLLFDAGDGKGYRAVAANTSVEVIYDSVGEKELRLKVYTSSGEIFESHSVINIVEAQRSQLLSTSGTPEMISFSGYHDGYLVRAQVSYYSVAKDGTIKKPFIVVEGFDPWQLMLSDADNTSSEVNLGYTTHADSYALFYGTDLLKEYDLVYVDWDNSLADIRANAKLLVDIINTINRKKAEAGSTEKNVIMGQSMGGLITRYALLTMEENRDDHQVSTFISHDSPHLGANLPVGIQYFITQLISFVHGYPEITDIVNLIYNDFLSDVETAICKTLHSRSARQMLLNYVDTKGNIDNSVHIAWQEEPYMKKFPIGDVNADIENLSIVNGRIFNLNDHLAYNYHYLYLDGWFQTSLLTDLLGTLCTLWLGPILHPLLSELNMEFLFKGLIYLGSSRISLTAVVNPLTSANAGNVISELNLQYTKNFLWLFPKTYNIFSSTKYAYSSGLFYDAYPGSKFTLDDDVQIHEGGEITDFGTYSYKFGIGNGIMFIPVASALSIGTDGELTVSALSRDYYSNPPKPEDETPFSSYYLSPTAQEHITLDNNAYEWMKRHLDMKIAGADRASTDSVYSIVGFNPGNIQWKTSDASIATISSSGKLTATGSGFVKIIAETRMGNQLYRKSKTILVNFPDLIVNYEFEIGTGYRFTVKTLKETDQQSIDDFINNRGWIYEWTKLDWYGNRETIRTKEPIYEFLPDTEIKATIGVRLVAPDDIVSPLYSETLDLKCQFYVNYSYVTVNSLGNERYFTSSGGDIPSPIKDFGVQFLGRVYSADDNIYFVRDKYLKGTDCYIRYSNNGTLSYFTGVKVPLYDIWSFDVFDSNFFLNNLRQAKSNALSGRAEIGDIIDMELIICNSIKEPLQRIPFAIIHVK